MRANADFSGVTTLVTLAGKPNYLNLAIDPSANLIFWTDADADTIGRASLAGGPIIGTFSSPGAYPDALAVDPRISFFTGLLRMARCCAQTTMAATK